MAIIVNVIGTNVMAKDETNDYSFNGYEQWKGNEYYNNGMINPVIPGMNPNIPPVNNVNETFPQWNQPPVFNYYNGDMNWNNKEQSPSNVAPPEIPAWNMNDKNYQQQVETQTPEKTPDKTPEQTPVNSTKKSENCYTFNAYNYNAYNFPAWGQIPSNAYIPGNAYIPNQVPPIGYEPPANGQDSDKTSDSKSDSPESKPDKTSEPKSDIYNNNDFWKEQNSDNTYKPEFNIPAFSYNPYMWWQNNNVNIPKPDMPSKEDSNKEQNSDNKAEQEYNIPNYGYNSTQWWQNSYDMDKYNFDNDKFANFPVQQQINGLDTAFLQNIQSNSKLALVNLELEKARQELVVVRNDARRQISIEIKEIRLKVNDIISNSNMDKNDKRLRINEIKNDFRSKVKNIKQDAEIKAKAIIEKQDTNIQAILS